MKNNIFNVLFLFLSMSIMFSCNNKQEVAQSNNIEIDISDSTNDFYDNVKTSVFTMPEIEISGEILKTVKVDFTKLKQHSLIVKETILTNGNDSFTGAFQYSGFSLHDILNNVKLDKKNKDEFRPIVDLYVEILNDKNEKVRVSWGEIYYPTDLHKIIIATSVRRIVPSKTKELWELPTESKLIVANDLLTERNISNPTKIIVKSYQKSFEVKRHRKTLYSPSVDIFYKNEKLKTIYSKPIELDSHVINTIFYGRGRGIHSTLPFTGFYLKDILIKDFPFSKTALKKGLVIIASVDGYRAVFTYSEIFNRNDQSETLMMYRPQSKHGGKFRLFPSSDFFSDRAIKAVSEIHFLME
ncbi:MAG: hypothetical protein U9R42_10475 [Bacteroidota bacterium]|nr:hypothetical protein [Bacteroidota bacterium]